MECVLKIYGLSVRAKNPKSCSAELQPPVVSLLIKEKTRGAGGWGAGCTEHFWRINFWKNGLQCVLSASEGLISEKNGYMCTFSQPWYKKQSGDDMVVRKAISISFFPWMPPPHFILFFLAFSPGCNHVANMSCRQEYDYVIYRHHRLGFQMSRNGSTPPPSVTRQVWHMYGKIWAVDLEL